MVTVRVAKSKLAFVFLAYFICVFRTLLSINSKYSAIQYSLIVFLMEEHYFRWGKQRLYYHSQKTEASVHSNAPVTHIIPFPNHTVPQKFSNVYFPFDLYFSTRGVWNENGKIKALQQASESGTGSDRLDLKRQQEFYFSYGLLYPSIDICFQFVF